MLKVCSPRNQGDMLLVFRDLAPSLKLLYENTSTKSMVVMTSSAHIAGPRSAVGNVSDYRCVTDCRSRGSKFDPGPVPYFRGD